MAYSADVDGSDVKRYDPSSPELSAGAALGACLRRVGADPAGARRFRGSAP